MTGLLRPKRFISERRSFVKRTAASIVSLLFLNSVEGAVANSKITPLPPAKQIESLIHNTLPNASVGIVLKEAKTGKTIYEKNAHMLFTPASVVKLFTAAASLLSLGPDYRYVTTIHAEKGNFPLVESNNLYIRFSGDPSLTREDLKQLITQIKTAGMQRIPGNIIVDNTLYQTPNYAMGWSWESLAWYYAAPVTSIILNENQIPININSSKLGEKAQVLCNTKECEDILINAEVISVPEREAETQCQIQADMDQQNVLNLKGCWPQRATPTTLKVALKNPSALVEKLILEALKAENIQFDGKIMMGTIPQDLPIIASHYSEPLSVLLKYMLQNSNNIYSDSLTKALGVKHFQQGTFQAGIRAIKEVLAKPTGIDFKALRLFDGSGASHYNLIAPQQIAYLLLAMYHDKKNVGDFQKALAVSGGEKGNLSNRMQSFEVRSKVLAKTGSLSNVSALAGYLTTQSNKDLVFVIMIDRVIEDRAKVKNFEDQLCRLFVNTY